MSEMTAMRIRKAATLAVAAGVWCAGAWLLAPKVRSIGLGRIGSAVIVGMVLIVGLWFVGLPFSFADLWWQHHWGLGPFDILAWLNGQWALLPPAAVSAP